MKLSFTKMEGCGNDYIYVDGARFPIPAQEKPALVRRLSDRHFGIGGDGVIFINPAPAETPEADFEMEMYNADGSRSEMCGNGIRCVGAYVYEKRLTDRTELAIVSAGAIKYLSLTAAEEDGVRRVSSVRVDMGAPVLEASQVPVDPAGLTDAVLSGGGMTVASYADADTAPGGIAERTGFRAAFVSMGNPHAVIVLPAEVDLAAFPLEEAGPWCENHPAFPRRTNTEFVHIDNEEEVHMRVWERGTGETLACGTGCCATAVACHLQGFTKSRVTIHVRGGEIVCEYDREADRVYMTGPAVTVFEGECDV